MKKILLFSVLLTIALNINAQQKEQFFEGVDKFLNQHVAEGLVEYKAIAANSAPLEAIVSTIENFDINTLNDLEEKAFYINAYNILVIKGIVDNYPTSSPQQVGGFFDSKKYKVGNQLLTLNQIENDILRKKTKDARLHFVLVCGALGCPKIINQAYVPETLENQLEERAKVSLNDNYFIRVDEAKETVLISEIFKWYKGDFVQNHKSVQSYINEYRTVKIPDNYKNGFYNYDWTLNAQKTATGVSDETSNVEKGESVSNIIAFTPSVLLKKGQIEVKNFNNVYSQTSFDQEGETRELDERQTFYTGIFQITYGSSKNARFNIGLDININHVSYKPINGVDGESFTRTAIGSIGPRVKVSPFKKIPTFSVQSSLLFPVASDLESPRFLAHDRVTWWTQFFYDKTINNFQIFVEADLLLRFRKNETFLRTPVSLFLSYFPSQKVTFYTTIQHSPRFQELPEGSDSRFARTAWFNQAGLGVKYQISPQLNIEALVTDFFGSRNDGLGKTYNIGFRFIK